MEGQITLNVWQQWRDDIKDKLAETADNFVYIGYRLKQIRDSGMYDGADNIFEFAQREYGLTKSTVSRFIAINERFSEDGNSLHLKAAYRGLNQSKLTEMLGLTDEECTLITEQTTVKEIRDLKNIERQQEETTPQQSKTELSPLQKCIYDFFRDKRELLNAAMGTIRIPFPGEEHYKRAMNIINPSGYLTHHKGIVFIFMYDWNKGVSYKQMGKPEPVTMPWIDFIAEIREVFIEKCGADPDKEEIWAQCYRDEAKEKEEKQKEENRKIEERFMQIEDPVPEEKPVQEEKPNEESKEEAKTIDALEADSKEDEGQQEKPADIQKDKVQQEKPVDIQEDRGQQDEAEPGEIDTTQNVVATSQQLKAGDEIIAGGVRGVILTATERVGDVLFEDSTVDSLINYEKGIPTGRHTDIVDQLIGWMKEAWKI